jgi:hypothetical protein
VRPPEVEAAWAAGHSVVPADLNKRPKVKWKHWQEERQTAEEFEALGHGSVWGLVTGAEYGIAVLDFDFDAGGEDTLAALDLTPHVYTPGGAHVYVNHPGHPVKNAARKWDEYPGLDVRGDGGLAWFAGRSRKGVYKPQSPFPPDPIDIDPALAEVFFPHPQETERAERREWTGTGLGTPEALRYLDRLADDIQNAAPGTSNARLNKAAYAVGGLVAAGQLSEEHAFEALFEAAELRGAGEPEEVIQAGFESGAAAPWKFDPPEGDYIPLAAYRQLKQGGVPEPVPFPIEALPAPLDEFVVQVSRAVSSPPDYVGAGVLPVLGLGLGGYVSLQITDSWRESPLLYTALVGLPSARKSPALSLIMAPVIDAENALYESVEDEAWVEQDPPQLVADDATIESLFGILEANPRGIILHADELDGWVAGMGQYKGGGGRDRQHWLSIWSRKPIKVTRKTTKSHRIPKPFAAVLGGIQPEPLEALMHGRNDGLLPRILMAQGQYVVPRLDRRVATVESAGKYDALWNRLRDEGLTERVVQFTDAGYHTYETWANEHYDSLARVPRELAGAFGKMDAQAARIALILSVAQGEREVSPDSVDRAVALVGYFKGQAGVIYESAGSSTKWEKAQAARNKGLARWLLDNPGAGPVEIMEQFEWATDSRALDRALEYARALGVFDA